MKVICAKLSSGEEIIGRCVDAVSLFESSDDVPSEHDLVMSSVRSITLMPGGPGQPTGLMLIPFAIGNADAELKINRHLIIATYEPVGQLEKEYLAQTSGIQLAGGKPTLDLVK